MTNTAPLLLPSEQDGQPVNTASVQALLVRYCLYASKSSEQDERQALSIDSQVKEMLGHHHRENENREPLC